MKRRVTQFYAVLVGGLGVIGLLASGHILGIINVDGALDITRLVLAAGLVYAGFIDQSERTSQVMLTVVGMLYLGIAVAGLISPTLGGLLPSGLTGFDIAFHIVTGGAALAMAVVQEKDLPHSSVQS